MPKKTPLVSFCVPTYRRAAFIAQTLQSALDQTVTDIEIVVVDDVSPDNTAEVVQSFSDRRIRYIRNTKNLGVPENLNRAIFLGTGTYLVLLEDHDLLEPTYLEETLKIMERYPSVGFAATGLVTIDESGNMLERYVEKLPEFMAGRKLLRRLLTRTNCPFSVTTVIRRSAIAGLESLFDSRYLWYADQYLWLRLSAKFDFGYAAQPLLKSRVRETDHYLVGRHWESSLCLDRIHQDNWSLLHPQASLSSYLDWFLYDQAKLRKLVMFRAGQRRRGKRWTEEDDKNCHSYLSPVSRWRLKGVDLLPLEVIASLHQLYHLYRQWRTNPKDVETKSIKSVA